MRLLTKIALLMFVYSLAEANNPVPPPPPPPPTVVEAPCWPFLLGALPILAAVWYHWNWRQEQERGK